MTRHDNPPTRRIFLASFVVAGSPIELVPETQLPLITSKLCSRRAVRLQHFVRHSFASVSSKLLCTVAVLPSSRFSTIVSKVCPNQEDDDILSSIVSEYPCTGSNSLASCSHCALVNVLPAYRACIESRCAAVDTTERVHI